jgi:hypothetical protein
LNSLPNLKELKVICLRAIKDKLNKRDRDKIIKEIYKTLPIEDKFDVEVSKLSIPRKEPNWEQHSTEIPVKRNKKSLTKSKI